MRKLLALLLATAMIFALCACGGESQTAEETDAASQQEEEKPAAGEEAGEPQEEEAEDGPKSLTFDFGTFQVRETAFCSKAELFINVITWTSSSSDRTTQSTIPYYLSANENCLILAIRGTLTNTSDQDVPYDTIKGSVRFGENEELNATLYPYEQTSEESFRTLFAGASAEATICAQVPVEQSVGESRCLVSLGGAEMTLAVAEIPIVNETGVGAEAADSEGPEAEEAEQAPEPNETAGETGADAGDFEPVTIETDAGIMVIRGYSFSPKGFKGYSNTDEYDNYSIFTVHATITLKGEEPKSSWSSFQTKAFQNGIDARRYTDFSKKTHITTDLMPGSPVEIDYDFLVESPTDPITFMVRTWGHSKTVFQQELEIDGSTVILKK